VLRGSRLVGWRAATIIQGLVGIAEYAQARGPISAWAADPKTDAALLRRALEDVREIDGLSTPCSGAYQVEYLVMIKLLDDPDRLMKLMMEEPWAVSPFDRTAWYN